jgi:hypothetical protein
MRKRQGLLRKKTDVFFFPVNKAQQLSELMMTLLQPLHDLAVLIFVQDEY